LTGKVSLIQITAYNVPGYTHIQTNQQGGTAVFLFLLFLMCPLAFVLFFVFLASAAWPILLVLLVVGAIGGVSGWPFGSSSTWQ
jgi:hypothetical protein